MMSSSRVRREQKVWNEKNGEKKHSESRLVFFSPNIVSLCMDSYDMEKQCGKLYHMYTAAPCPFSSLFEAFEQMERLYDGIRFPQASTQIRNFSKDRRKRRGAVQVNSRPSKPEEYKRGVCMKKELFDRVTEQRGEEATFLVHVKYRQNSSWQGEVTWVEEQRKEYFRSALELIRLIDSALEKEDAGTR